MNKEMILPIKIKDLIYGKKVENTDGNPIFDYYSDHSCIIHENEAPKEILTSIDNEDVLLIDLPDINLN